MSESNKFSLFTGLVGGATALSFSLVYLIRFLTTDAIPLIKSEVIFYPMLSAGAILIVLAFCAGANSVTDYSKAKNNGREVFCGITGYLSLLTLSVCVSAMMFYQPMFNKLHTSTAASILGLAIICLVIFILCFVYFLLNRPVKPVKKIAKIKASNNLSRS